MKVIGFGGKGGVGKDYLAQVIIQTFNDREDVSTPVRVALADPLKGVFACVLNCSVDDVNNNKDIVYKPFNPDYPPKKVRTGLIDVSEDYIKPVIPTFWCDGAWAEMQKYDVVIITDMRYFIELGYFRQRLGKDFTFIEITADFTDGVPNCGYELYGCSAIDFEYVNTKDMRNIHLLIQYIEDFVK